MEVGIVDGDTFDPLVELLGQCDGLHERAEGFRAAVDTDENRVRWKVSIFRNLFDDPHVAIDMARNPLAHRSNLTVLSTA